MGQQDYDLSIARFKKNSIESQKKEEINENAPQKYSEQIKDMIQKVLNFTLAEHTFFEGLFTMVLPEGIFYEPLQEGSMVFFQSNNEHIVLVTKVIHTDNDINLEKMKTDYIQQMKESNQQTKIDLSGNCDAALGQVYYFTATHSMPEEGQCDFVVIFKIQDKMVLMNFDFLQKDYVLWKTVIRTLLSTIQLGKGEGEVLWKKEKE